MVDSFQGTALVGSSFTGFDAVNIIKPSNFEKTINPCVHQIWKYSCFCGAFSIDTKLK